jgi:signal peptide peptidase SppA
MTTPSIDTLQAASGRLLHSPDPLAWESTSQRRTLDLVRQFQRKAIDVDTLRAGLSAERTGSSPSTFPTGVAVLNLTGPLTPGESIFSLLGIGTSLAGFTRNLFAAAFNSAVKAIAIIVDSPGGSVAGVAEVAATMRRVREKKPIVAVVPGMGASAAYWIISNASTMESTPSGSVGSVGIITERVSLVKQLAQDGVDVTVVSAGKFKSEGHPATAMSDAERQALQRRVDAAYGQFVADISAGRHVSAASVRSGYGEGRLVDAPDALAAGMIDRISTVDDALARLVAAPSTFTAIVHQRAERLKAQIDREQRESMHQEIDRYRVRLRASMDRTALR